MQGAIHVARRCEHHPTTAALLRHKLQLVLDADAVSHYDYRCASVWFIVEQYSTFDDAHGRVSVKDRIVGAASKLAGRQLVLLIVMTTTDPSQEVLNWLNVECGIELRVAVVLCWSHEEAATVVQHARTAAPLSLDYAGGSTKKEEAPLPALIDAFTQSPQVLTRQDVVRLSNRHRTVAEFLSSDADALEGVPGMGKRKVDRLQSLLNSPFSASTEKVSDVLHGANKRQQYQELPPPGMTAAPTDGGDDVTATAAQKTMAEALRRRHDEEDGED